MCRAVSWAISQAPLRLVSSTRSQSASRLLEQRLGDGDAGVVDQDGDRPQLRLGGGHGLLHAFGLGDVEDDRHGAAVEALDLLAPAP